MTAHPSTPAGDAGLRHLLLPHPLLSLVLLVCWLLLNNSLSTGHLLLGALLGWLLPLFTRRFWPERVSIRRLPVLLRFVFTVLWDILVANLLVARLMLGPTGRLRPAFVVVPLDLDNDLTISLLANTISLTPGTVSARLYREDRILVVHALDVEDVSELVRFIKARYEAPIKEVFEP